MVIMSKSKKYVFKWVENHFGSLDKVDSATWDKEIKDVTVQKAIAKSRQVQACYSYIESKLVHEYAKIIMVPLNNAFFHMTREDFIVPRGFSDQKKASPALKDYFELSKVREQFIRADIAKCDNDARLHAFRRWITVVEILLHKNHYEAAFAVMLTLSSIDDQYNLSPSLPSYSRDEFERMGELLSPMRNFKVLRTCIAEAQKNKDARVVVPLVLVSKDLTSLNEFLGDDQGKSLKNVRKKHPSYAHFVTKEAMLDVLMNSKPRELAALPEHLQRLYDKLTNSTSSENSAGEDCSTSDELSESLVSRRAETDSTLYSKQLHPTLWSRRGRLDKTTNTFWKDMFQVAELPTPLQMSKK